MIFIEIFFNFFLDSVDQNIRTKPPENSKTKKKKNPQGQEKAPSAPPQGTLGAGAWAGSKQAGFSVPHRPPAPRPGQPRRSNKPNPPPFHPKLVGGGRRAGGGEGGAFRDQELPAECRDFSVLTPPPRHTINTPNLQVSSAKCPPFPPKIQKKLGGGGVVQLGSYFSFWIKTPKKKSFPLVLNPRGGGMGVGFSVSPKNVHFWNKKRLKTRVKNQTQHQQGPRGVGRWNGKCLPHQWDWGSQNEYPPSGMGTVGGTHREPE